MKPLNQTRIGRVLEWLGRGATPVDGWVYVQPSEASDLEASKATAAAKATASARAAAIFDPGYGARGLC